MTYRICSYSSNTSSLSQSLPFKSNSCDSIQSYLNSLLPQELLSKQKPYLTRSKKQLYSYKIRKNMIVGAAVTLRKKKCIIF